MTDRKLDNCNIYLKTEKCVQELVDYDGSKVVVQFLRNISILLVTMPLWFSSKMEI